MVSENMPCAVGKKAGTERKWKGNKFQIITSLIYPTGTAGKYSVSARDTAPCLVESSTWG